MDATPSRSFLEGLFADAATASQAALQSTVGKLDKHYQGKLNKMEKDMSVIRTKQDHVAKDQEDMRASIGRLEASLLLAETSSRAAPPGSVARPAAAAAIEPKTADLSILRINTSPLVPFAELRARLDALCAAAQIDAADYEFSGPQTLGQRFSLAFRGEPGLAARRAKKVQQSLRNADGTWSRIQITSPSGDPIDAYIGPEP